jgi:hypothetical protein
LCVISLALLSIALLAVAFAVSLDRSYDLVQIPLFLLAATLLFHLLILPLKGLQRKVAKGSFLPSGEECAELCERYWKPQEIELACLSVLTASIWSCWPINRLVLHRTSSGADVDQWLLWVVAAIWWVGALRRLWRVFHPVAIKSPEAQRFDGPTRPEVRIS